MERSGSYGRSSTKFLFGVLLVIVVASLVYFFLTQSNFLNQSGLTPPTGGTSPQLLSLSQQIQQGDLTAIDQVQQFLANNNSASPLDVFEAQKIINGADLALASTSPSRLKIYQAMLMSYDQASTPILQAWALNDVIIQVVNSGDSGLIALISHDPKLSQYVVTANTPQTITNLATYSYGLYPTAQAAYLAPAVDEERYIGEAVAHTLGSESAASKDAAKANILSWLSKGDQLYAIEQDATSTIVFGASYAPWEQVYRGTLLGAVSLIDSSYWQQADAAFQTAYADYNTTLDSNGNQLPILITPAATALLSDARFLYLLDPKGNAAAIKADLQHLALLLDTNSPMVANMVSWMNELLIVGKGQAAVTSAYGLEAWAPMQSAYTMYLYFAKISPEFKSFLQSQGWKLSQ